MASTFSTNLAIELIGTGDQAGTWGVTTNTNLGTLIEQAISGYVTQAVATGTDTTITIPNGSTGVARNMYIELTGTGGTNTNLIVPANKKLYFVFNNSTGAVTVKVSGQTGVSVPQGKKVILVSNGTDIVNGLNYIADFGTNSFTVTNLTATSGTITNLIATTGTITTLSATSGNISNLVSSDASATVLRAGSATLTHLSATSASITNLTLTSLVISNLSIASANVTTLTATNETISGNLTLSDGTANGVLYLNGSKVATSGSALSFTGSLLKIGNPTNAPNTNLSGNLLQVKSASGFSYLTMGNGDGADNNTYIGSASSITTFGTVTDAGTTSELMRLTSTGLGIGTSSPAVPLDVVSNSGSNGINIRARSSNDYGFLNFKSNDGSDTAGSIAALRAGVNSGSLLFYTGTTEKARLDTSGNLGIGTSSPQGPLDVAASGTTVNQFLTGGAGNNAVTGIFRIGSGAGRGASIQGFRGASSNIHSLDFYTYNAADVFGMRLDSSGNLGIGTSSPASQLDVSKTGDAVLSLTSSGVQRYQLIARSSGNFEIYDQSAAASRVIMTESGNLGLGVTPSAWSSTLIKAIQIGDNNGSISSYTTGNTSADWLFLNNNAYYDAAGWKYIASSTAAQYAVTANEHRWYNAPSGTAGNAISFTQAMTLDASGNLVVGNTTANERLEIYKGISYNADPALYFRIGANDGAVNNNAPYTWRTGITGSASGYSYVFQTLARTESSWVERARITSGGDLLVGTTTSANSRVVAECASTKDVFRAYSPDGAGNTYSLFAGFHSGATLAVNITTNGNITNINGSYGTISDAKMKTDIVDAGSQWHDIKSVRFRKFKMKDDASGLVQLGVVAQELEQVSPGLVDEHADRDAEGNDLGTTTKSVKTSVLLMKAAVALQEAMARIEKLEAEVAALKGA